MRAGWLLFCIYGLSLSTAHASTLVDLGGSSCSGSQSFNTGNGLSFSCSGDFSLSAGSLSSDTGIILSSLGNLTLDAFTLSAPSITLNATSIHIGRNVLLSPVSWKKFNLGADITVFTQPALTSVDNIALLPGGNINLINSTNRDIISGTLIPQISGGDITISRAGSIDAGRGSLSAKDITMLTGGNISLGTGTISIIPLPASFTLLLTGLLTLLSLSGRSLTRKSR